MILISHALQDQPVQAVEFLNHTVSISWLCWDFRNLRTQKNEKLYETVIKEILKAVDSAKIVDNFLRKGPILLFLKDNIVSGNLLMLY